MTEKKTCDHMNPDGTFKEVNGSRFNGCVLHMMECEGHDKESATKICGKIAQEKLPARRTRNRRARRPGDGNHRQGRLCHQHPGGFVDRLPSERRSHRRSNHQGTVLRPNCA